MASVSSNNTEIYRMTCYLNLNSYLHGGTLFAKNFYRSTMQYVGIHNPDVQEKRGKAEIPFQPGATLLDCVPFYFGVRTPMLYVNKKNQDNIIYLVTTAQTVANASYRYFFTDGHAIMVATRWYNDIRDLDKLDWNAINAKYWGPQDDPSGELKRKKQAEFLVYHSLSWNEIKYIVVRTEKTEKAVLKIMQQYSQKLYKKVFVCPQLYF